MDTPKVHPTETRKENNSGREIQNLEKVISYIIGEQCVIQTVSEGLGLLHGEVKFYYVDTALRSVDSFIQIPRSLETEYNQIGNVKTFVEHQGDIKMYRNKDTPGEIIVLVTVPEELELDGSTHTDRHTHSAFRRFFRSMVRVLVEGAFRSIIMPIP